MHGKNILITGGAGFIATTLAERLVADNQLTLFDLDFAEGKPIHHSDVLAGPSVETIEGDIRDRALVAGLSQDSWFLI